ncbi:hypothetical protein GE09DRAFT_984605 [Coniochaeta sp. 2T2.1]|nr:hypothetical protein GE09DRAFT_984605 [Coniochaeta sp. 2T2.1]
MPRQNLTANACTVCRKKRTKCDGRHPCRRCVSRGEDCVYEDKMWRTKDHLRSEIERLRKEVQQCQGLIKALTIGGPVDEWKSIQTRMHRGEAPERIAACIASSRSPASGNDVSQGPTEQQQTVSPDSSHPSTSTDAGGLRQASGRRLPIICSDTTVSVQSSSPEDTYFNIVPGLVSPAISGASSHSGERTLSYRRSPYTQDSPVASSSLRSWTGVTQDIELLHRLLYHYFDNCFPDLSFVSKERFMKDLDERTGRYCSPALVNAILGLASQTYNASPDSGTETCPSSQFLSQASQLLRAEKDNLGITNIQATGILALAEANIGHDGVAFQLATDCVRKAVLWKMKRDSDGVQSADPEHQSAMATAFCGAFSLVRIFRILTGRLSCQSGPLFMRLTQDGDDSDLDSPAARVERGVSLQQHFFNQLDHCTEILKFINTITEVAHTFCTYHHDGGVTPADLIPAYDKCLQAWGSFQTWLPNGTETNKYIVFAQIWYNYILMVLFSILIKSPVDLRDGVTPRAVVIQASETIISLMGVYQDKCGFQSVHPLLPHMAFAATLVQIRRAADQITAAEQQTRKAAETGDKRKRSSESSQTTPVLSGRSSVAAPQSIPSSHRSPPSHAGAAAEATENNLVFPSWEQHIVRATMDQAGVSTNNIKSEADGSPSSSSTYSIWPSKPASKLAAEGTLYLTKIGITNAKAASLAKILHAHSSSTTPSSRLPSAPAFPPSLSTPGWKAVN